MKSNSSNVVQENHVKITSVEDYLAIIPPDARSTLQTLRFLIKSMVPEVTEGISYQIIAFKYKGRLLIGLGAAKKHCSIYVMSYKVTQDLYAELEGYSMGKATIRFPVKEPPPDSLIKKLVMARIAENESDGNIS